jgi:hypothetical protein
MNYLQFRFSTLSQNNILRAQNPIPKPNTQDPKPRMRFFCIRDLEGAEGGTSWNERRDRCSEMGSIWLSEVQRSTGAIADPGKSPTPSEARGNALINKLII